MEKSRANVSSMFNNIAKNYDFLNDFLSFGIHRVWKKQFIKMADIKANEKVLDCATGTGDLAINIKKNNPTAEVKGIDISSGMLEVARKKKSGVEFIEMDLLENDFLDNEFNTSLISFGIRNVQSTPEALKQLKRISNKNVMILEFFKPDGSVISKLMNGFFKVLFPIMGKLTGDKAAYEYLNTSRDGYYTAEEFIELGRKEGLELLNIKSHFFGLAHSIKFKA